MVAGGRIGESDRGFGVGGGGRGRCGGYAGGDFDAHGGSFGRLLGTDAGAPAGAGPSDATGTGANAQELVRD
ncbi:hypothetical protein GCM10009853_019290 [Glycomyces scopariae]